MLKQIESPLVCRFKLCLLCLTLSSPFFFFFFLVDTCTENDYYCHKVGHIEFSNTIMLCFTNIRPSTVAEYVHEHG